MDSVIYALLLDAGLKFPSPTPGLEDKVTDLEFSCWYCTIYLQTLSWIWFIYGMLIDTGLNIFSVANPPGHV